MEEPHLPVQPPPTPPSQRTGLAVTSMVLGSISVACLGLVIVQFLRNFRLGMVLGVISATYLGLIAVLSAILTGHIAYGRTRRAPERYGGAGFAVAGLVMGCAGALFALLLLLAVAVPSLPVTRKTAWKRACIGNLKQIDAAKEGWAVENRKTAGEPVLDEQVNAYLKNSRRPACPSGGVYSYNPAGKVPTCSRGAELGHTL